MSNCAKSSLKLCISRILSLLLVASFLSPAATVGAQDDTQSLSPQMKAQQMLSQLTPEEKVGQLLIVSYTGTDVGDQSQIYDLITNRHIGGVILSMDHNNFIGPANTIESAASMIRSLQTTALGDSAAEGGETNSVSTPLLIGMSQEGDGYPNDQILYGLTTLPTLMSIGASWRTDLAEKVGNVLGKELEALGVNFYIGPSLDVSDTINTEGGVDIGTRVFGGDPYWVGEMGKAYIKGIHDGSQNRILVIAKHFPGRGGADRPPGEEVSTVRKSLEQLKQIELAPFFEVTGKAQSEAISTDGLLVSHIRYQGFQGNIRATTRPVSLDQSALEQLMDLEQFSSWRDSGGIMVSDDLGSQALQKFYTPASQFFDARQVALSAFLAGNDLLYVNQFQSTGDPDSYTTIINTLDFLSQKYREDPAFAQRVDVSVERILTLKYQLYPQFTLADVLPGENILETVGKSQGISFEVAQSSATLISPSPAELSATLPMPPAAREKIIFITDSEGGRQCSTCTELIELPVSALENAVIRLYGPQAGGKVVQYNLSSYSFEDLNKLLNGLIESEDEAFDLEEELRQANWIVFSMLNIQENRQDSSALRRLLSERRDLLNDKKIIAFAFNAPYYLDATDISKLTAYYGVYSKSQPFVDVAARILFQELTPSGALPVSVPGVGYDLIHAMSPQETQVIPLRIDIDSLSLPENLSGEGSPTESPLAFRVGDTIPLVAGVVYDNNRHPVPDGTIVRFHFSVGGEGGSVQQIETVTKNGIARTTYPIQNPGLLEIKVVSDPATVSDILQLDVSQGASAVVTAIIPTPIITETVLPTQTSTVTIVPTFIEAAEPVKQPNTWEWLLSIMVIWGSAVGIFMVGKQLISLRWGMRWGLLAVIGGMAAYIFLAANTSVSENILARADTGAPAILIIFGIVVGWGMGWVWWQLLEGQRGN